MKKEKGYFKRVITLFIVISILLSIAPYEVNAQQYRDNYINFSSLTIDDGLSQASANYIYQDSYGYIWIGTADGLNRYNGYDFKKYKFNDEEEGHISSNYISTIIEDNEKNLWVGTTNGLNKLDRKTDKFYTYTPQNSKLSHYNITEIMFDDSDNMWVATEDGVSKYEKETDSFKDIFCGKNDVLDSLIYTFQFDDKGRLWLGSENGLQLYDVKNDSFISLNNEIEEFFYEKLIYKLYYDKDNNEMWVGTEGYGAYKIDLQNNSIVKIGTDDTVGKYVRYIMKCDSGFIWLGTSDGLVKYDKNNELVKYSERIYDKQGIISNNILSLCQDRNGLIWVGTAEGISRFNSDSVFRNYKYDPENGNSLSSRMISGIYEDDEGYLWVNTTNKGINIIDRKNREVSLIGGDNKYISGVELWSITGKGNNIYIATSEGLLWIDKYTKDFELIRKQDNDNLDSNEIRKLYIDNDGLLWIGTRDGISTLDKNGIMTNYSEILRSKGATELFISAIHQDKEDERIMWFGSSINGGLIRFNKETQDVKIYRRDKALKEKSLSINSIKSIDEDDNGNLWIGTNCGLNMLDKYSDNVVIYTEEQGLSNNFVYGVLLDEQGNIWCSTNEGLSMLNVKTKEFNTFTVDDGIASNEFNGYSYYKNSEGIMFFGGVDGLTTFNPSECVNKDIENSIFIDSIKVRGNENFSSENEIYLNYNQNTFDVEFFLDDYKNNRNKKYEYMLEGFDTKWMDNENRNYISYTNIPSGHYKLHIKGRNSVGKWSEVKTISINITNPPWKTPVAYWAYTIVVGIIIYIWVNKVKILEQIVRQRTHELNIKLDENKVLYDKVIQHERYKNNYFVNLSHELRTPLNVIVSTEQLITRLNEGEGNIPKEKLAEYMSGVKRNANRLLNLINNIIDTSKIDAGAFKITKKEEDIVYIVEETALSLKSLAEKKKINLIIDPEIEEKIIKCDKYNIERCITNLVGNALKFTPNEGEIIVSIKDCDKYVKISVKDNGIGIDKKYHKAIFDRFGQAYSQVSEEYGGSGLGLTLTSQIVELHNGHIEVKSEVNEGAEFIITLPVE